MTSDTVGSFLPRRCWRLGQEGGPRSRGCELRRVRTLDSLGLRRRREQPLDEGTDVSDRGRARQRRLGAGAPAICDRDAVAADLEYAAVTARAPPPTSHATTGATFAAA
jgi:hypothetical protein